MLFTVVDQQSRYKAKNVIDTVVYRFGDFSNAWVVKLADPAARRNRAGDLRPDHLGGLVPDRLAAGTPLRQCA